MATQDMLCFAPVNERRKTGRPTLLYVCELLKSRTTILGRACTDCGTSPVVPATKFSVHVF
jgi:hypothetical protein